MKNYVVIGGSSGIGKSLVQELKSKGHKVYATYCKQHMPHEDAVEYHRLDVLEEGIDMSYLPEEIHGVAYCPGSIALKPFKRFKEEDFVTDFRLQVVGATKVIQAVMPKLVPNESSIVMFSTVAVQKGFPFHAQVSASKGAVEGLTRALAAELAPKVRVNAIAPSLIDTPLADKLLNTPEKRAKQASNNPLGRFGTAQDVAQAAAYLLGGESSWVTGQVLSIDGGYSRIS